MAGFAQARRPPWRALAVGFLCIAICAGVVGRALSATKPPDPKAMVLRASDFPGKYARHPKKAGYVTNALAQAREARKGENWAALGRMNGYEETFLGADQGGQVTVDSTAAVFATRLGAHRALGFVERDGGDGNRYRVLAAPIVGDESALYQVLNVANTFLFAWRSGVVFSTVEIANAQASDAIDLGKRQQRHVAAVTR